MIDDFSSCDYVHDPDALPHAAGNPGADDAIRPLIPNEFHSLDSGVDLAYSAFANYYAVSRNLAFSLSSEQFEHLIVLTAHSRDDAYLHKFT